VFVANTCKVPPAIVFVANMSKVPPANVFVPNVCRVVSANVFVANGFGNQAALCESVRRPKPRPGIRAASGCRGRSEWA
jgi:hypothetical protein